MKGTRTFICVGSNTFRVVGSRIVPSNIFSPPKIHSRALASGKRLEWTKLKTLMIIQKEPIMVEVDVLQISAKDHAPNT